MSLRSGLCDSRFETIQQPCRSPWKSSTEAPEYHAPLGSPEGWPLLSVNDNWLHSSRPDPGEAVQSVPHMHVLDMHMQPCSAVLHEWAEPCNTTLLSRLWPSGLLATLVVPFFEGWELLVLSHDKSVIIRW